MADTNPDVDTDTDTATSAGALTVVFDGDRVVEVSLIQDWQRELPPETFGAALTTLLVQRRVAGISVPTGGRRLFDSDLPVAMAQQVQERMAAWQLRLLGALPALLAGFQSGGEMVRSTNGKVTLRVVNGTVAQAEADPAWLARTPRAGIVEAVLSAFERAYELIDDPESGLSDPLTPFLDEYAEIGRLLDDFKRG